MAGNPNLPFLHQYPALRKGTNPLGDPNTYV